LQQTTMKGATVASLLLALLALATCEQLDYLQATENPHVQQKRGGAQQEDGQCSSGDSCPVTALLDPAMILSDIVVTQPDTLLAVKQYKYMGVQVPIYHFKQPDRLNPDQLPFRIIRVRSMDLSSVVVVPHPGAHDSWFPAYYWDVLVCGGCDGWKHIGWRFSPKGGAGEPFYALIVEYGEGKRRQADAHPEGVLDALTVGVRAPAWLIALATATLSTQVQASK